MSFEQHKKDPQDFHPKYRDREVPSLQEMKETPNSLQDYRVFLSNFFRLLFLDKQENGYYSAKKIFQSPCVSHPDILELISSIDELYTWYSDNDFQLSEREKAREEEARRFQKLIPLTRGYETDSYGYYDTPRIYMSGAGTFFTNIFKDFPTCQSGLMRPEEEDYRVNLALIQNVSNVRVLMDLYDRLILSDVLAKYGFKIKSIGNNRTDAVIVYCGENALSEVVGVVGNYCREENLGAVPGVPFGVRPVKKDGKVLPGISVTSNPFPYTFNDLQSAALAEVAEKCFGEKGLFSLDDAKILDDDLLRFVQQAYVQEMSDLCHRKDINVHNLAFPQVF